MSVHIHVWATCQKTNPKRRQIKVLQFLTNVNKFFKTYNEHFYHLTYISDLIFKLTLKHVQSVQ